MNTFNMGFVFGQAKGVCIVVCSSNNEINREKAQMIAANTIQKAANAGMNAEMAMRAVVASIKAELGIDAVLVNSDVACVLPG